MEGYLERQALDVIAAVASWMPGDDILRLASSTPRLRRMLLEAKVVTSMRFEWANRPTSIPRSVTAFPSLRELTLSAPGSYVQPIKGLQPYHILSLPPTLTSLELWCANAFHVLFRNHRENSAKKRSYFSSITASASDLKHLINLGTTFPLLQSLVVKGEDNNISCHLVPLLPPCLTRLELETCSWSEETVYEKEYEGPLPESLTRLSMTDCSGLANAILQPLTQLTSLSWISKNSSLPALPTSLTDVKIDSEAQFAESWCASTLPSLTNLRTFSFPLADCLPHLPPSITSFKIYSHHNNISMEQIKALPRDLKSLSVHGIYGTSNGLTGFPPDLTSLSLLLPEDLQLKKDDPRLGHFPVKLKSLDMFGEPVHLTNGSLLPRTLTHISGALFMIPEIMDFSTFPVTITELSLTIDDASTDIPGDFSFPPLLKRLSINSKDTSSAPTPTSGLQDRHISQLPDTLESLFIADAGKLTDAGLLALPSHLKSLFIRTPHLEYPTPFTQEGLKQLPRALEHLRIDVKHETDASFIPLLPRGLLSLTIIGFRNLSNKDVALLPPGLKSISLRNCNLLDDGCLRFLPRSTNSLELQANTSFTVDSLKHLPYSLIRLDIRKNPNFPRSSATKQRIPPGLSLKTRNFVSYDFC
jgi:hypothetical protein